MPQARQRRKWGWSLAVVGVCMGLFGLGRLLAPEMSAYLLPGVQADELPQARVEAIQEEDVDVEAGRVVVGEQEVLVLAAPIGGFSGYERALIVADRLNRLIQAGAKARDVVLSERDGMPVIEVQERLLVSVTAADGQLLNESPQRLAEQWAHNIRAALGNGEEAAAATAQATQAEAEIWRPTEPYDEKYVPILSLLEGTRVGVARINGPRSRVKEVQAVTQFSINFRKVLEIDIYVPVRVSGSLDRVQGVGVTGLGDLKL